MTLPRCYRRRTLIQTISCLTVIRTASSFARIPRSRLVRIFPSTYFRSSHSTGDSLDTAAQGLSVPFHGNSNAYRIEAPPSLSEIERLRQENLELRQSLELLELENDRLHRNSRIVLENFEGEGRLREIKEKWKDGSEKDLPGEDPDIYNDPSLWCDELEDGACPLEPTVSFGEALRDRAYWLVGLLVLQSLSGFILSRNEALLENHPFSKSWIHPKAYRLYRSDLTVVHCVSLLPFLVIFFLTMLVGAGGNAGNQASVRVIRGLALETLNEKTQSAFLIRELKMAGALSVILSLVGFMRAALFHTPFLESLAVTASLSAIVFTSVCLGAVLPLILKRCGVDPAHSSTTIQVAMDILGVYIAVFVSKIILDSPLGSWIVSSLGGG